MSSAIELKMCCSVKCAPIVCCCDVMLDSL